MADHQDLVGRLLTTPGWRGLLLRVPRSDVRAEHCHHGDDDRDQDRGCSPSHFSRPTIVDTFKRRASPSTLFGGTGVQQGHLSHVLRPVVPGCQLPMRGVGLWVELAGRWTIVRSIRDETVSRPVMETFTLGVGRCWILSAFGGNSLVRVSDRLEAVLRIAVLATALVVAAVAGAIGTAVYDAHARLYLAESQTRHSVTATEIEDSAVIAQRYSAAFRANARWRVDGSERVGSLNVDHEIEAADPLDVWVDDQGIQVAAPTPTWRAGIDAVLAGSSSMGERRSGRCRAIGMDPRAADSSALHRLGPRVGDARQRRRWPNR